MAGWVTLSMSQIEEDTAAANKLFIEAVKLVKLAENVKDPIEKSDALEEALRRLNKIIDDYSSTDLAVKLSSGQNTGAVSLKSIGKAARKAKRARDKKRYEEQWNRRKKEKQQELKEEQQKDMLLFL